MIKLYLVCHNQVHPFLDSGLTAVGGLKSSGLSLNSLKLKDDYAIISTLQKKAIIHPLKGKLKGPIHLESQQSLTIEDLTIICLDSETDFEKTGNNPDSGYFKILSTLINKFAEPDDLKKTLSGLLQHLSDFTGLEKSLLVTKDYDGRYKVKAEIGLKNNDTWMSETLVQETLKNQKPVAIKNIFGSPYDSKKSLVASGFVSVFTWPLLVRGQILGLVLLGSLRPHSGLSDSDLKKAQTLVDLLAVMFWFAEKDFKLKEEIEALKKAQSVAEGNGSNGPFLTLSPELADTVEMARKVSQSNLSILIQGETGVGKEVLATWVHKSSDRSGKPLVSINCGAIPLDLIESTLFGHKKGSFTGAYQDQTGKFQQAHGGTLFLDEIGDLPLGLQGKLLRALQEKYIEPIGSSKSIAVDVRIVAATHKDIPKLIREGKFREDLYFRMAEITLTIPPLRNLKQDITLLATDFLKKISDSKKFSRSAWDWLKNQAWNGNVRELLSAVKRACILSEEVEISVEDLTRGTPSGSHDKYLEEKNWLGGDSLDDARARFMMDKVNHALSLTNGHRQKAAELLGITSRTLFRYLEENRPENLTELS